MPRALEPRHGRGPRPAPKRGAGLPRDVAEEIRRIARPTNVDDALARTQRAIELLSRDDHGQAVKEAEKAKALAGRSAAIREILAMAYYAAERWQDALREMQAYRRMSGRLDQNHIIADCYRALGKPDRAVEEAEAAVRARIPEEARAEAAIVGASALADAGRFRDALSLLRRVETRARVSRPHDLRLWYVHADILARAGKKDEAAQEFRRILRHDQTAFDTAERLADLG